jgi:hypothetical protein
MRVSNDHPLVGTWITDTEDSNVAFTISVQGGRFRVAGFCRMDGEQFEIYDLKWRANALSFMARMPSTNTVTKNCFRIRSDGRTDLETTIYEVWNKRKVKIGERPRGWDREIRGRTNRSTPRVAKTARA